MKINLIISLTAVLISAGSIATSAQANDGSQRRAGGTNVPEAARILRDLAYIPDGHERQKLDLYLPGQKEAASPLPLIVWVHGGAWLAGSKENCRSVRFLRQGYAAASINYRLSRHADRMVQEFFDKHLREPDKKVSK